MTAVEEKLSVTLVALESGTTACKNTGIYLNPILLCPLEISDIETKMTNNL